MTTKQNDPLMQGAEKEDRESMEDLYSDKQLTLLIEMENSWSSNDKLYLKTLIRIQQNRFFPDDINILYHYLHVFEYLHMVWMHKWSIDYWVH